MYTVSKAPNGILAKTRILGMNSNKCITLDSSHKSISSPNEKNSVDSDRKSPSVDRLTIGPRPVFLASKNGANSNRRKPRSDNSPEEKAHRVKPDAEVVSFFALAWNSLQTSPESDKKNSSKANDIVYYRPHNSVKVPDFTPCNYERVWADHHYRKLIRHIDLSIQNKRA